MTPQEIEYLAEMEPILIIPNFTNSKIWLIYGDIGPFKAGMPVQVPLWLAVVLRRKAQCRIVVPDWMTVSAMEKLKQDEIDAHMFTKMPSEFYMPIAKILYDACSIDIPDADAVKVLIKDVWDTRTAKLRTSIKTLLEEGAIIAKVNNLTMMEIVSVRPFLPHALEQLFRMRVASEVAVAHGDKMARAFRQRASASINSNSMSIDQTSQSQSQSQVSGSSNSVNSRRHQVQD